MTMYMVVPMYRVKRKEFEKLNKLYVSIPMIVPIT